MGHSVTIRTLTEQRVGELVRLRLTDLSPAERRLGRTLLASYPIAGTTWAVFYANPPGDEGRELVAFLRWATHDGQKFSADLSYAPLPDAIVKRDEAKIMSISVNGAPAFPGK